MPIALLDTDILSEILKRKDPIVLSQAATYAAEHRRFTITAVSVHEIIYGLEFKGASQQMQEARTAFAANEVVVPDITDYETAGRVRGIARRRGNHLALDDCLIAAVAARLGLSVVTGNTKHFKAIQETGLPLTLENWRKT